MFALKLIAIWALVAVSFAAYAVATFCVVAVKRLDREPGEVVQ